MYEEFAAPPSMSTIVEAVWTRSAAPGGGAVSSPSSISRVLPDGCTDLIWVDGELLVAGPDTRAHLERAPPSATYAAVRFRPGAGPALLGLPGHELRDGRVPLAQLWPAARVRCLADRITAAAGRTDALLEVLGEQADRAGPPDPVAGVVARAATGRHRRVSQVSLSVADIAATVGFSERQLHRRCLAAFGYGPRTLVRILRFRHAVALARDGVSFAAVAARTGYADQPHLCREVRALAGVSLGTLIR